MWYNFLKYIIFQFIDDGGFPIFPEETKEVAPVVTNPTNQSSVGTTAIKPANGRVQIVIFSLLDFSSTIYMFF